MVSAYSRWHLFFPDDIEICIVNLPGRGKRISEKPFFHISELVPALAKALSPLLKVPFAFLGHSMGAVLAFEIARYLRRQNTQLPTHLFCCSCPAPQTPMTKPLICNLPDEDFLNELNCRYGAIPASIRQNRNMLKLFLPSLRADFTVLESYAYIADKPLDCAISVYAGYQDQAVSFPALADWRIHASQRFQQMMFEGDHFFLHRDSQTTLNPFHQQLIKTLGCLQPMRA